MILNPSSRALQLQYIYIYMYIYQSYGPLCLNLGTYHQLFTSLSGYFSPEHCHHDQAAGNLLQKYIYIHLFIYFNSTVVHLKVGVATQPTVVYHGYAPVALRDRRACSQLQRFVTTCLGRQHIIDQLTVSRLLQIEMVCHSLVNVS